MQFNYRAQKIPQYVAVSIGTHRNCDYATYKKLWPNDTLTRHSTPNGYFWTVQRSILFSMIFHSPVARILFFNYDRMVEMKTTPEKL